ncbi:hypothetical protein AWB74_01977 [Caballeronia arvi]|uniref:Uncharacterized protein n=1 Tax=Caballeronia arvi TaxID=1777135 RepID=A0A158HMG5_9BURK|nr:hypothetical protein [Caballeronia arvi]SAL45602.1 hypothetical protein AWB74_01977 [Caballeronia arvi]
MSDPRTLVKSYQYIDLPGEPPEGKLWPGVNNIIVLRKHRDVVFDIKLKPGATYTLKTDRPESKYGRFYDTRHKQTIARTTFNDGEPLHIWVGRRFQGNLILLSGDNEIGHYPVRKMDCAGACTNDPKDKPAPMFIVLRDDTAFAQDVLALSDAALTVGRPSAELIATLDRAHKGVGLQSAPFDRSNQPLSATVAHGRASGLKVVRNGSPEVLQTVHIFEVTNTNVPNGLDDLRQFFVRGDEKYAFDPNKILCRNWLIQQSTGLFAFALDALKDDEAWLRKFWNRKFYLVRSGGKFVAMFSTGPEDWRILGVLLTGYKKVLPSTSQIMTLAGGAGTGAATWSATKSALKGSVVHGAGVAVALNIAIDGMVWFDQYKNGEKDLYDLFTLVGVDLVTAGLYAAGTALAVSAILTTVAALSATGFAISMVAIAVGTVVLTVSIGYAVDWMFNELDVNNKLSEFLRGLVKIVKEATPSDYGDSYAASQWAIVPEWTIEAKGDAQ